MTKDEVFNKLLKDKFIVQIGDDNFEISNNLYRVSNTKEEVVSEVSLPNPLELLKKFIKDSQIPFRAKTSIGSFYQLAPETDYSRRYLYNIINKNVYKYEDMVNATKSYYNNTSMARVTLTNFFKQGIFEQVMEEYLKNPTTMSSNSKTNRVSL